LRILIVEDETMAGRMLKNMLIEQLGNQIKSIHVQTSLTGSECFIWEHQIDLLFLDLDLNGEDGFDLLKNAVAGSFHTIIVSAHANRAVEAFEYGVIDFVPKPYSDERIRKALERYNEGFSNSRLKYLSVVREGQVSLVPIESINYFEAFDKQVKIFQKDGGIEIYNKMMQLLEKILPADYIRIHRSYIANFQEIKEVNIQPNRRYSILLNNGAVLPVSRNAYQVLKNKLEENFLH
jgi:two-component system response regulator LytT